MKSTKKIISIDKLRAFENHPYKVQDNEEMEGLTPEVIAEIMEEEKANQKERVKIPTEKLRKYFPKNYTVQQIEDEIIKLCEKNYRMKQRDAR